MNVSLMNTEQCAYLYKMSASHIEWDRARETLLFFSEELCYGLLIVAGKEEPLSSVV